jgi:hypothetical protein
MYKNLKKYIYITLFLISVSLVNNAFAGGGAPPPKPPGGGGGPPCWPPPCVPIDGGISFLLVAGALYGGKKMYDISKNNEKTE